ncbi:hypothetical protein AGMMS49928_23670 [Spirochaetia bacterium]|nr:hypothetical protein AGMMS49928_23670 [Spirochaetia bacterium]
MKDWVSFTAPDARVLLVDDIPTNLAISAGMLGDYHVQVDTCSSGEEAIARVRDMQYDIVFMDHMMPGMDGMESTRHIREIEGDYYRNLPIIALTANSIPGMRELFLGEGFNDFLTKPIEPEKLAGVMNVWIPEGKKQKRSAPEKDDGLEIFTDDLQVEGLDIAKGKAQFREKGYFRVLKSYCTHTPALLEKIKDLTKNPLSEETIGEYIIDMHGIKGSTFGICADDIAKQAEDLEAAARNGDRQFIELGNTLFIWALENLIQSIEELLEKVKDRIGPDQ